MALQLDSSNFNAIMDTATAAITAGFGFGAAVVGANSNNNPANANYTGGPTTPVYYQVPDNRQAPQVPQAQAPQNSGLPIWVWVIIGLLFAAAVGFAIYKRRGAQ